MPKVSELFFKTAILFLIAGISIGLVMSATHNYDVAGAHAHINLLGWVTSAVFGGYYALNPAKAARRIAYVQYVVYTVGVIVMTSFLFLAMKGYQDLYVVIPLAVFSFVTAFGVLLFAWVVFSPSQAAARGVGGLAAAE